jgi:hypothetical protein
LSWVDLNRARVRSSLVTNFSSRFLSQPPAIAFQIKLLALKRGPLYKTLLNILTIGHFCRHPVSTHLQRYIFGFFVLCPEPSNRHSPTADYTGNMYTIGHCLNAYCVPM